VAHDKGEFSGSAWWLLSRLRCHVVSKEREAIWRRGYMRVKRIPVWPCSGVLWCLPEDG
jgi:hypothetical protein